MSGIPITPWVKGTAEVLTKYGEPIVTLILLAIGISAIAFAIFGSFWAKAVAAAYLLTP